MLAILLASCQAAATPTSTPLPPTPTKAAVPAAPTTPPAPAAATATAPAPAAAPATPTKPPVTPTSSAAQPTGKVIVVITGEPDNFESENFNSKQIFQIGYNVVERLVERDPKTFGLKGLLAEKWEQVKPDTWRFTLRKNVKFHNGETLKAADAAATLNRLVDPARPEVRVKRYFPDVKEAIAVDDNTLDIVNKAPDPIMPLRMFFMPVDSAKFVKENPEERPTKALGTGPYKFVEWVRGQFIRLTANENYWGTPNIFKDVTFVWRKEPAVRAAMLMTGEVQVAQEITPSDAKKVKKAVSEATVETPMIRFDSDRPPFKDVRIRKAMSLALDRKTFAETVMEGNAQPASQMFAPFTIGYDPNLKPVYDVEGAKKLVKEAGAEGLAVPFDVYKGRYARETELAEAIVGAWTTIGLKPSLTTVDVAKSRDLSYAIGEACPAAHSIEHGNEFGDAAGSFDSYIVTGGRQSCVTDAAVTKLIKEGSTLSGEARAKKYQEVSRWVYENVPVIPLIHRGQIYGLDPTLDWKPRIDGLFLLKEFSRVK